MVFLCHKCSGVLSGDAPTVTYKCHCMSGWVRDWQSPTPVEDVLNKQIDATVERLMLYQEQGRDANDSNVVWARETLRRLNAAIV